MSGEAQLRLQLTIDNMSQNMIIKQETDGSLWAKITPVRKPGDVSPGSVYINGKKYTTASTTFVQIYI